MNSKKRGSVSLQAERAKEDFVCAMDCAEALLEEFEAMGLQTGTALGGALTTIITHLIAISPDTPTAMGMLSSCITNAAFSIDMTTVSHPGNDEIH